MHKTLIGIGSLLGLIGAAMIVGSAVASLMGISPSYNFGNPAKFQFYLVPLWQIGCAVALVGGGCLLLTRWLKSRGV